MTPTLTDRDLRVRVTGRVAAASDKISLTDAEGGRRWRADRQRRGFAMLEELAGLLRRRWRLAGRDECRLAPARGPDRADRGRIAPELRIACGISGAIKHIVGCKAARNASHRDQHGPEAPILSHASYAVIGDLHTIVPAISAEIRRTR
jgi:electron transfer flavoprotein alpha subunit